MDRPGTCIIILDKKYNIANTSCHFGSVWSEVPWTICYRIPTFRLYLKLSIYRILLYSGFTIHSSNIYWYSCVPIFIKYSFFHKLTCIWICRPIYWDMNNFWNFMANWGLQAINLTLKIVWLKTKSWRNVFSYYFMKSV